MGTGEVAAGVREVMGRKEISDSRRPGLTRAAASAAGDGCGPTCAIDPCFTCANEPSICTPQPDGTACQDDFFCNGNDACIGAACSGHAGNPCPSTGACSFACNEESQTCQTPLGKSCQSDADPCTHDACDAAGSCEHLADTSACRADVECAVAMILTPPPLLDPGRVEFTIYELGSVQIDTYDVAGTCAGPGTQLELFQVLEDQSVELLSSAVADDPLQCPRIQTHLDGGDYAVEVTSLFAAAAPPVRIFAACTGCGDASLDFGEECDDGNSASDDGDVAYTPGDACAMDCTLVPCGRPVTGTGSMPMAKDALLVLRTAVGAAWCVPDVCDTDSSGVIDAIDALRVLLRAVGGTVELDCPVGLGVTTTTTVPVSTTSSPALPDTP